MLPMVQEPQYPPAADQPNQINYALQDYKTTPFYVYPVKKRKIWYLVIVNKPAEIAHGRAFSIVNLLGINSGFSE